MIDSQRRYPMAFRCLWLALLMAFLAVPKALFAQTASPPAGGKLAVPAHQRIVLGNGAVLLLVPMHDVPLVSFHAVLRGGALADPAGKPGVSSLVAGLLEKGAGKRDAFTFVDTVANVGGSFAAAAYTEAIAISGEFLARDRLLMVELLADALQRPQFPQQQFTDLRARRIEFLKAAKDSSPGRLLPVYAKGFLFGDHPYARPVNGSESSLASISLDDVWTYYRAHFGADRLILTVAGDFDPAEMQGVLSKAFGGWPQAAAKAPSVSAVSPRSGRRVLLIDSPGSSQTYFWAGNVGVARNFAQRPALDLVNTVFGGRFTSMLNTALRIKSGLSYGARSGFERDLQPGPFSMSSFTKTGTTVQAVDLMLETLTQLKKQGISQEVLASAKAYVLGQYPPDFETAAQWAGELADLEFYGLKQSYISDYGKDVQAVDSAATQRVIGTIYPAQQDLTLVLIGDAAVIRDQLKKYGPVTEMPLTAPHFTPAK